MSIVAELGLLLRSAEEYESRDPAASIWKAGLAGEFIASEIGRSAGLTKDPAQSHENYLDQLEQAGFIDYDSARKFHQLRRLRNRAAHEHAGAREEARRALALVRALERLLPRASPMQVREAGRIPLRVIGEQAHHRRTVGPKRRRSQSGHGDGGRDKTRLAAGLFGALGAAILAMGIIAIPASFFGTEAVAYAGWGSFALVFFLGALVAFSES